MLIPKAPRVYGSQLRRPSLSPYIYGARNGTSKGYPHQCQRRKYHPVREYREAGPTRKKPYGDTKRFPKVKKHMHAELSAEALADFDPDKPRRFIKSFKGMPAMTKWFITPGPADRNTFGMPRIYMEYLKQFEEETVPLEFTGRDATGAVTFERREGPFSLLLNDMRKRHVLDTKIYLAQHNLADLPLAMQEDVPMPEVVKLLGKGDIYGSSLWMGRAPTRTPLHRDPNPNLLVQLTGGKVVRLFKPEVGRALYERVKEDIKPGGHANLRGREMMQGDEMEAMEKAVWDDERQSGYYDMKGEEVYLQAGDGVYIPLGWWHAVRGIGQAPSASVNWWFR